MLQQSRPIPCNINRFMTVALWQTQQVAGDSTKVLQKQSERGVLYQQGLL